MTRGAAGAAEVPPFLTGLAGAGSPRAPAALLSLQGLGKQAGGPRRKGNAFGVHGTAIAWLFL